MRRLLTLLIVFVGLVAVPASGQQQNPTVKVGEVFQVAFDPAGGLTPVGYTERYKVTVDGQPVDAVYGTLAGSPKSLVFAMPPFTTGGVKTIRVSAIATITDPSKASCDGTVSTVVECPELVSGPVALTVLPPSIPQTPPENIRIIVKTTTVATTTLDGAGRVLNTESEAKTTVEQRIAGGAGK